MMNYTDIALTSADQQKKQDIKGLITIVHAVQTRSREFGGDISVAIDFPEMINETTHSNFGNTLRLIGDRQSIMAIISNSNLCNMEECGQISIGRINEVPKNINEYVMVKRDRRYERFFSGREGSVMPDIKPCFLAFRSKCNGRSFSMNIVRMKTVEPVMGEYTVYGLSYKNSAIPSF